MQETQDQKPGNGQALDRKKRAIKIIEILSSEYPYARCHLNYDNPFQLLISTILAAQCTDERVNLVMGELYKKYKTPVDFINVQAEELERELSSINFFRNKTKSVRNCCKKLDKEFKNQVPKTMKDLTFLPGVGRKTANVILGNCFGVPVIITDTHLIRVSTRLGLTMSTDPDKIEQELKVIIPEERQMLYSHIIGEHGRQVCKARKPMCTECAVNKICPGAEIGYRN